jgi:hypothetical protein
MYRCGRKNSLIWERHSFGWGARRQTAVYVPFSVYTMAWSGEHRAFIVESRRWQHSVHFASAVPDKENDLPLGIGILSLI